MIGCGLNIITNPICQTGNSDRYLLHYRDFLLKVSQSTAKHFFEECGVGRDYS
jgi:hypothetical protein